MKSPFVSSHSFLFTLLHPPRSSFIPVTLNTKEGSSSLFCSELVAYMYQGVGLLKKFADGGTIPNEYSPCDFSTEFASKLNLLEGHLGEEVIFGFPPGSPVPLPVDLPSPTTPVTDAEGDHPSSPRGVPSSTLKYFNKALQKRSSSSSQDLRA